MGGEGNPGIFHAHGGGYRVLGLTAAGLDWRSMPGGGRSWLANTSVHQNLRLARRYEVLNRLTVTLNILFL